MALHQKYYLNFLNEDEKIFELKRMGLLPKSATKVKPFLYKGLYTDHTVKCDVKGYLIGKSGIYALIIDLNGKNHVIHPDYLKEMQKPKFKR